MTVDANDGADAGDAQVAAVIDRRMLEALVCPMTQGTLSYDADAQELVSKAAKMAFPIRNGIPIMLVSEARAVE